MSTNDGLFTLRCAASPLDPSVTDLTASDPLGVPLSRPTIDEPDAPALYSVAFNDGDGSIQVIDSLSSSLLSSTLSVSNNKLRLITLHNPTSRLELRNKSLISFSWIFDWQDMRFSWGRSRDTLSTSNSGYTLKLDRGSDDPDVAIAIFKPSKRGNLVQILDYNLDRFTIDDRKGLEIVIISSLFAVLQGDKLDEHTKDRPAVSPLGTPELPRPGVKRQPSDEVEAVSENEIVISNHLSESAYVTHCVALFNDPNLVFLTLLANAADTVPRAISIASEVKRHVMKHRSEDLMQFIDYPGRKDSSGEANSRQTSSAGQSKAPPRQMKIYLSRILLQEFVPKQPTRTGSADGEKARLASHFATQAPSPPPRTSSANIPHTSQASPATLHKKPGSDPRKPPLPPKNHANKEEEGRFRSFWSRVTSDNSLSRRTSPVAY